MASTNPAPSQVFLPRIPAVPGHEAWLPCSQAPGSSIWSSSVADETSCIAENVAHFCIDDSEYAPPASGNNYSVKPSQSPAFTLSANSQPFFPADSSRLSPPPSVIAAPAAALGSAIPPHQSSPASAPSNTSPPVASSPLLSDVSLSCSPTSVLSCNGNQAFDVLSAAAGRIEEMACHPPALPLPHPSIQPDHSQPTLPHSANTSRAASPFRPPQPPSADMRPFHHYQRPQYVSQPLPFQHQQLHRVPGQQSPNQTASSRLKQGGSPDRSAEERPRNPAGSDVRTRGVPVRSLSSPSLEGPEAKKAAANALNAGGGTGVFLPRSSTPVQTSSPSRRERRNSGGGRKAEREGVTVYLPARLVEQFGLGVDSDNNVVLNGQAQGRQGQSPLRPGTRAPPKMKLAPEAPAGGAGGSGGQQRGRGGAKGNNGRGGAAKGKHNRCGSAPMYTVNGKPGNKGVATARAMTPPHATIKTAAGSNDTAVNLPQDWTY